MSTAALDARLLVAHELGLDAVGLVTREHEEVSAAAMEAVEAVLRRRLGGESVGRILGRREFYGLDFALGTATLEPRPDTELLVDLALKALPQGGRLLDLGTGTGCIPIALLHTRRDAEGLATDLSPEALAVARRNAAQHGVEARLGFAQGDWFGALAGPDRFDLIVSNPPYIESAVVERLAREVRDFDPLLALDGGPDGLAPYRVIAAEAGKWLKPGGQVLVEIGFDQGERAAALFAEAGFKQVEVQKDLAGLDRVVSMHHIGA